MSQPFSFPPPPPPPPKRENTSTTDIRGGFRGRGNNRGQSSRGFSHSAGGRGSYGGHNVQRGRGNFGPRPPIHAPKRDFSTAFAHQSQTRPRAPPAVPSFDVDIKSLVSGTTSAPNPEATRKKANLLGLTPTTQDASESEDDGDDETKLAAITSSEGLQFEHRGQTLSLTTPGEIAAWIAERRKRYPTQAKVEIARREAEEKRKAWEEQKRARDEAFQLKRQAREKERSERDRQRLKEKAIAVQVAKAKSAVANSKTDTALEAKQKADKLRRRAEKAARDLNLAEEQLRHLEDSATNSTNTGMNGVKDQDDAVSKEEESTDSDDDVTSSSGSSVAGTESDSAPEESTSKRFEPESVASQSREMQRDVQEPPICKNLVKFGRCKFGKRCRFSHKLKKEKQKQVKVASGRRKGLYQVMVEKEREEELQHTLRAIIALGERGLLDEPQSTATDNGTENITSRIADK